MEKFMYKLGVSFATLIVFALFAGEANASVILSNGEVTFDNSNGLTQFKFTLTSNTIGQAINVLVFDADGGASWDDPNAMTVFESTPWTPIAVEGGEFFAGNLDVPVVFDGVSGIIFNFIFQGAQNVVGNQWQISAGTTGQRIDIMNNINLAIGQAGSVSAPSSVPEAPAIWLFGSGLAGLTAIRKSRKPS